MSGGMHVFDMIKRLQENDNLKKMSYFKTKGQYKVGGKALLHDITATEEERRAIRKAVRDEQQKERRRTLWVLAISAVVTVFLFALILLYVRF